MKTLIKFYRYFSVLSTDSFVFHQTNDKFVKIFTPKMIKTLLYIAFIIHI